LRSSISSLAAPRLKQLPTIALPGSSTPYRGINQEKEGGLSVEEKSELDHVMDLDHIVRMAKARAR
jgi:hypothetical protein